MRQLLRALGVVLILGGVGHAIGVVRFYVLSGLPDPNRLLLDVWIGESQLLGGAMFFAAFRNFQDDKICRVSSIMGALIVLAWAVPIVPVIFVRAPRYLLIPPLVYGLASVCVLIAGRRAGVHRVRSRSF